MGVHQNHAAGGCCRGFERANQSMINIPPVSFQNSTCTLLFLLAFYVILELNGWNFDKYMSGLLLCVATSRPHNCSSFAHLACYLKVMEENTGGGH